MTTDTIKLQSIDVKAGKTSVPSRRIASAADAKGLVHNLIEANSERSRFNAKIKGCIDGNPPYNPSKLRAAGQAYRANVNFMEFDAAVSAALVPYYDLFSGSRYYAEIKTDYGETPDQKDYNSRVITEEFDTMLKEFDGFDFNIQSMLNDYIVFGRGFVMWEDPVDWVFTHVPQHKIYVPDGTECSTEKLEVLVIRASYRVHQLWNRIRNRSAAETRGWNTEEVARACMDASQEQVTETSQTGATYELLQQKITDRDLSESMRSNVVKAAHVFVREFDNTITHMIIDEESPKQAGLGDLRKQDFLYYKQNEYKKFNQAVATFFFETRDGSWNGTLGFGRKNYSTYEIKNRLRNTAIDNVFLRSGITLQARSQSALENTALVQVGSVSILPPDFEVQQATIYGDVESQIAVNRDLDSMLVSNTGIYRPKMESPAGNPRTATEIQAQFANNATLTNSAVNRFYGQLDKFYREVYRRAVQAGRYSGEGHDLAAKFLEGCERRGVPKEAIDKAYCVRACRVMGNGSIYMRQQAVQQTAQLVPMFNEQGRQAWLDDSIASFAGFGQVERWNPKRPEDALPSDQLALAIMENGLLSSGAPVQWTPTNNDMIHAQAHLQAASQAAGSLQEGGDPVKVVAALDMFGPHIQIHIEELAKDPSRKDAVKMLMEQWSQLADISDQIKEQMAQQAQEGEEAAATAQQAQAVADGTDPDTALKVAKAQKDMELKEAKTQQMLRQKEEKHRQQMALSDAKTAFSIQQQAAKAKADAATKKVGSAAQA